MNVLVMITELVLLCLLILASKVRMKIDFYTEGLFDLCFKDAIQTYWGDVYPNNLPKSLFHCDYKT